MNPSLEVLNKKLLDLEKISKVSEYEIESAILSTRDSDNTDKPCDEWRYEVIAFSFSENQDDSGNSGTYFGPMWTGTNAVGEVVENPSRQDINADMFVYLEARSQQTTNPLLKARYIGLLWDFTNQVVGNKPKFAFAVNNVEALLRIAAENLNEYEVDAIQKLKRALYLAMSLNNPTLIERARDAILDYETRVAQDDKAGLWGFSFDTLVGNKKVALPELLEARIIQELEDRLARLIANGVDPFICEHAAERLAGYYQAKGQQGEVERVISVLGGSFELSASKSTPLHALTVLERTHKLYLQYGLRDDAARILKNIRSAGPAARDDLQPFKHEFEINREEFENHLQQFLKGDAVQALEHVALAHIPQRGQIEKQLDDLSKTAPLSFMFQRQVMDASGRTIATIGSLDDDLDGHVVHQMSQNMGISQIFLHAVLSKVFETYQIETDQLLDYLLSSAVISEQQKNFLQSGISAYFDAKFDVAIHLLIPQIEAALRNIAELSGGAVLKTARGGGFHLKTLDELLRSAQVEAVLNSDVTLYLRVLLTDQRGWNIRNSVCHGMSPFDQMSKGIADRLIHVLLLLPLIQEAQA